MVQRLQRRGLLAAGCLFVRLQAVQSEVGIFSRGDWYVYPLPERKSDKMGRQKGFTLVEILIVVLLLGVLAAIVLPKLNPSDANNGFSGPALWCSCRLSER
jgi:prepilin-type N-terminal cleavage/methylation domain-containing protein